VAVAGLLHVVSAGTGSNSVPREKSEASRRLLDCGRRSNPADSSNFLGAPTRLNNFPGSGTHPVKSKTNK
ncbi:MAG: hypothetical protein PVF80_12470, partial [Gammaproteobacteria bacterium]